MFSFSLCLCTKFRKSQTTGNIRNDLIAICCRRRRSHTQKTLSIHSCLVDKCFFFHFPGGTTCDDVRFDGKKIYNKQNTLITVDSTKHLHVGTFECAKM